MANESDWTSRVAAWRKSGQSAAAFCPDKEYSASSLYHRAGQLKGQLKKTQGAPVSLAPVVRKAAVSVPSAVPILVHLGSARLEISDGTDRSTLSEVLHALAESAWGGRL